MAGSTIKSLERGLLVLGVLGKASSPLSLNEITEHFDMDRSSVFRLLSTLVKHGYVIQDESSKRYSLGYTLLELSRTVQSYHSVETALRPVMRDICEKTKQNTHCGTLDGREVVFLAVELPKDTVTVNISVGTREPAAATALGRALLALLPEKERERISRSVDYLPYTPKAVKGPEELIGILAKAGEEGIAFDNEEYKEGIICFAVPVRNYTGTPVCSLGISGHRDTILPHYETYAAIVKEGGREASAILGWKE